MGRVGGGGCVCVWVRVGEGAGFVYVCRGMMIEW